MPLILLQFLHDLNQGEYKARLPKGEAFKTNHTLLQMIEREIIVVNIWHGLALYITESYVTFDCIIVLHYVFVSQTPLGIKDNVVVSNTLNQSTQVIHEFDTLIWNFDWYGLQ